MAVSRAMGPVEWGLLLLLSLLWGGSFVMNEVALEELPPFTLALGRIALAALLLNVLLRARGLRLPATAAAWAPLVVMAALNNVLPFSLILWGQTQIASGLAAILNATTPLFTVLAAHVMTADERLTPHRVVGVLAGFGGVAVMIGLEALGGLGSHVTAQLACLAAALCYGVSGVWGRRFAGMPPLVIATAQLTASTALLAPLCLLVDQPWTLPAPRVATIGAVVGLAVLATALAYLIFFRILASAGATNLALVTFLIPVSAILLGVGLLGETIQARQLLGMALIGLGLAALDGRPLRWLARRRGHAISR